MFTGAIGWPIDSLSRDSAAAELRLRPLSGQTKSSGRVLRSDHVTRPGGTVAARSDLEERGLDRILARTETTPAVRFAYLHQRSARFRQRAALAFSQTNVGGDSLILQAIAGVDETIGTAVNVRIVDLSRITDHHQF